MVVIFEYKFSDDGEIKMFVQLYRELTGQYNVFFRRHNYAEAYNLASLYRGENNERRPCSDLPVLDLSQWQERHR